MNTPFQFINLDQGSREWLEWRHNGIGASDASTVLGENPWKSPEDLLEEKCGPVGEFFQNEAMSLGTELEPEARQLYISKYGIPVSPVCLQSTDYGWLKASLDGLNLEKRKVIEIKCGASAYKRTRQYGSVPAYYYAQTQHILAVTGLDSLDFWCYWPDNPEVLVQVPRNESYIRNLIMAEREFWSNVLERRESRNLD